MKQFLVTEYHENDLQHLEMVERVYMMGNKVDGIQKLIVCCNERRSIGGGYVET